MTPARYVLVVLPLFLCLACQAGIQAGPEGTILRGGQDLPGLAEPALEEKIARDLGVVRDVIRWLTELEQRAIDTAAELGPSAPRGYTQAENDRIRALLQSYLNYRSVLLRLLGYYSSYETVSRDDLRLKSFLLAYVSGLTLYREGIVMVIMFRERPRARAKLNEPEPIWGIPPDIFETVYRNITNPANVRLLGEAWAYYISQVPQMARHGLLEEATLGWLHETIRRQQRFIEENAINIWEAKWDILSGELQALRRGATFDAVSILGTFAGSVKVTISRPLISLKQVQELKGLLQPGDLILERRNWYVSNGFLPGFWPHMALYVGSVEDLTRRGLTTHPLVRQHLAQFRQPDPNGHERRVIEALAPGVIFTSLEESAGADYVAVLRPRVSEARKDAAIVRAFSHYGKPYDFDFDFFSTDRLVCTELIYRAYDEVIQGEGIQFPLVRILGRDTLPPVEVAQMFARERSLDRQREALGLPPASQLDFVLFLDGDAESGRARFASAEEFIRSVQRPGD